MSLGKAVPVMGLIFVHLNLVHILLAQIDHDNAVSVKHDDQWVEYDIIIEVRLHVEAHIGLID
jgi:hypothetical protein